MKTCKNCEHMKLFTSKDGDTLRLCTIMPEEFDDRLFLFDCSSYDDIEEVLCDMWSKKDEETTE